MIDSAPSTQFDATPAGAGRRLRGLWLWITRALWIAIFLAMLVLNGMAVAAHVARSSSDSGGGAAGLKATQNQHFDYVLWVDALGPAFAAGLQTGDVLLGINGVALQPGNTYQAVNARLRGNVGDLLTLTVRDASGSVREHNFSLVAEDRLQIWRRFRVPVGIVGAYLPTIEAILLAVYLLTSGLIFWRRSDDWLAVYLTLTLVLITPQLSYAWLYFSQSAAHWEGTLSLILAVAVALTLPNFYLLPNGRFVPRWTVVLAVIWVVWSVATELFPSAPFSIYNAPGASQSLFWLGWYTTGMWAQYYRFRYDSTPTERQQIKWVSFGLALAVVANIGWTLAFELFPILSQQGQPHEWMWLIGRTAYVLGMMMLPISFGIAVFRYRLWDIDNLINRTLVYGALTTIVIGIYVVVVTALDLIFDAGGQALSQIIALSLDLVLFEPLRERLQKGVDRLMFGESDDLPEIIERLGQGLRKAEGPHVVLPLLVETLAESLNLPYVAIALPEGASYRIAASFGAPLPVYFTWPLVYQRQAVGQLLLAPRNVGEIFKPSEWKVVENVSYHISIAVHSVLLEAELQQRKALSTDES